MADKKVKGKANDGRVREGSDVLASQSPRCQLSSLSGSSSQHLNNMPNHILVLLSTLTKTVEKLNQESLSTLRNVSTTKSGTVESEQQQFSHGSTLGSVLTYNTSTPKQSPVNKRNAQKGERIELERRMKSCQIHREICATCNSSHWCPSQVMLKDDEMDYQSTGNTPLRKPNGSISPIKSNVEEEQGTSLQSMTDSSMDVKSETTGYEASVEATLVPNPDDIGDDIISVMCDESIAASDGHHCNCCRHKQTTSHGRDFAIIKKAVNEFLQAINCKPVDIVVAERGEHHRCNGQSSMTKPASCMELQNTECGCVGSKFPLKRKQETGGFVREKIGTKAKISKK